MAKDEILNMEPGRELNCDLCDGTGQVWFEAHGEHEDVGGGDCPSCNGAKRNIGRTVYMKVKALVTDAKKIVTKGEVFEVLEEDDVSYFKPIIKINTKTKGNIWANREDFQMIDG